MLDYLGYFIKSFVAIFVVMDVIGAYPVYILLLSKLKKKDIDKRVNLAIIVATIILLVFLFLGSYILSYLNVSMDSFRVAGGLILLIIGLKIVLGYRIIEKKYEDYDAAVVPIATPLITGPAVIVTIMFLASEYGYIIPMIASFLNLIIAWILIRNVNKIYAIIGRQGTDVLSRIFGLLLTTIAVEFIKTGWMGFLV